ncbi:hypothetical protein Tco_1530901, partial [Tanacetum coccineum]
IMADVNAPIEQAPAVAPPTRTDEQILPRIRWMPIGKSNCYLDAEKSQSNPIYKIVVDILKLSKIKKSMSMSVRRSQVHKVAKDYKIMIGDFYLADDLKRLKIINKV